MTATEADKAGLAKTELRHRLTQQRKSGAGRQLGPPQESVDLPTQIGRRENSQTRKRIPDMVF